jgi:hypothetical protein
VLSRLLAFNGWVLFSFFDYFPLSQLEGLASYPQ